LPNVDLAAVQENYSGTSFPFSCRNQWAALYQGRKIMRHRKNETIFIKSLPVVLLGLISLAATAWAGSGFVQGTVTDPAGQPVKNAEIRIEPRNGGNVLATTKTDANGRYSTAALPVGIYRISLIVNGAVRSSINNTKTRANKSTELNFQLQAASASQKTTSAKKTKHMVWVPSNTGTHMGGRWVEVDDSGSTAADALNVQKANAQELQREINTTRPVTGGQ
jgi:Carboxypeptidase regulatory-like domain